MDLAAAKQLCVASGYRIVRQSSRQTPHFPLLPSITASQDRVD